MRRFISVLLVLGLLLAPLAAVSQAQPPFTYGGYSQGVIYYSTASVSCINTTTACALWSSTIPGALMATSANANWTPSSVATPAPLHLILNGTLSTQTTSCAACDSSINVGVNYGGGVTGVATLTLANAFTPGGSKASSPLQIDVWVSPIATATGTALPAGGQGYVYVRARMMWSGASNSASVFGPAGGATETTFNAVIAGTTGGSFLASAEQLNVLWQWASAAANNSVNIYSGVLVFGN